ncbi:unnamed protein product [Diplocarpon coronariae]|nr:hypothetical protein JHW43_006562 [Diplocarpon mali]
MLAVRLFLLAIATRSCDAVSSTQYENNDVASELLTLQATRLIRTGFLHLQHEARSNAVLLQNPSEANSNNTLELTVAIAMLCFSVSPEPHSLSAAVRVYSRAGSALDFPISKSLKSDLNLYFSLIPALGLVIFLSQCIGTWFWDFAKAWLMPAADIRVDESRRFVAILILNSRAVCCGMQMTQMTMKAASLTPK